MPNQTKSGRLQPSVEFNAPRPSWPWTSWLKFILLRLLILPLVWDTLKMIVNFFAGKALGRLFFDAQNASEAEVLYYTNRMNDRLTDENAQITYNKMSVITHDGARLETLEIRPPGLDGANDRPWLINFLGTSHIYQLNTDQFPLVEMMVSDARHHQCNVVGFNFRGVYPDRNRPGSFDDLVTDGIAQVEHILAKGVNPEKIVLNGVSLGAGIATLVASHFHKNGVKIRVFNDRSFSSMTDVLAGWIRIGDFTRFLTQGPLTERQDTINGYREQRGNIFLGWLAWPFLKLALALTKWDIPAGPAYRLLPATHKSCMFVSSGDERRHSEAAPVDDCIISSFARIQVQTAPGSLDAAAMQTAEDEPHHDGHFKMRERLFNRDAPHQTGLDFFNEVLAHKFEFAETAVRISSFPNF